MARFLTRLIVEQVSSTEADDRGVWRLVAPLLYQSDVYGHIIHVPRGFQTDFASVPRLPFAFALVGDTGQAAATVHDYAYATHFTTRRVSDAILLEALKATGIPWFRRWPIWLGVRLFGRSHW